MVTGTVDFQFDGALALVTLCQPGRFNAMSRAMWRQLELGFAELALRPGLRCVVVCGAGGNFCAGGDISEYPEFRFERQSLQEFHENTVWGALQAMLDCDLPVVARIDGNCIGAGLEIASCCDIRIAARSARFGAPIARLGFPMAPRELQLVLAQAGAQVAREMLFEAAVLDTARMQACGFLNRTVDDGALAAHVLETAGRVAALPPGAARLNKRAIRALASTAPSTGNRPHGDAAMAELLGTAYDYAGEPEHRAGIEAFIAGRSPAR